MSKHYMNCAPPFYELMYHRSQLRYLHFVRFEAWLDRELQWSEIGQVFGKMQGGGGPGTFHFTTDSKGPAGHTFKRKPVASFARLKSKRIYTLTCASIGGDVVPPFPGLIFNLKLVVVRLENRSTSKFNLPTQKWGINFRQRFIVLKGSHATLSSSES